MKKKQKGKVWRANKFLLNKKIKFVKLYEHKIKKNDKICLIVVYIKQKI